MLLILGSLVFVLLGTTLAVEQPALADFKVHYFTARCLLKSCDPYNEQQVLQVYRESHQEPEDEAAGSRMVITRYLYLPSAFSITVPLSLLPFVPAELIWVIANGVGLLIAAFVLWDLAAQWAPVLSGALLGFLVANSEMIVQSRNVAGMVIGLCLISVWCFVKNRWAAGGVACLAVSLALKPHDSILVWLFFLLAGGVFRRRALQTLAVVVAMTLPMIFWVSRVAPEWPQELRSHLEADAVRGGANDPGPHSTGAHGLGMMVNLQTAASFIRDDPKFYNPATYAICGLLVLAWMFITFRRHPTTAQAWLALACASSLTLLPFYHRQFDSKLLMLSIPACAMLWSERRRAGKVALLLTAAALLFTAELPVAAVLIIISHVHLPNTAFWNRIVVGAQILPAPLSLLAAAAFYLWIYVHRANWPRTVDLAADSPFALIGDK